MGLESDPKGSTVTSGFVSSSSSGVCRVYIKICTFLLDSVKCP